METVSRSARRRPKLVWVVFLWFVFSVGYTLLSFLLIHSGAIAIRPEQAAYLRSLSALDYALMLATAGLTIAGAVSLFLLRKAAFYLFVAPLVLSLCATMVHALSKGFLAALGGPGTVGMFIGYAVLAAVCVYTWKLKARGVLA
jgi:hypothetical protein